MCFILRRWSPVMKTASVISFMCSVQLRVWTRIFYFIYNFSYLEEQHITGLTAVLGGHTTCCYEVRLCCHYSFYFGLVLPVQLADLLLFIAIIDVFLMSHLITIYWQYNHALWQRMWVLFLMSALYFKTNCHSFVYCYYYCFRNSSFTSN